MRYLGLEGWLISYNSYFVDLGLIGLSKRSPSLLNIQSQSFDDQIFDEDIGEQVEERMVINNYKL